MSIDVQKMDIDNGQNTEQCVVCHQTFDKDDLVQGDTIRDEIWELIEKEHPDWSRNIWICEQDLDKYRTQYVKSILEAEQGTLTDLEKDVLEDLEKHELTTEDIESQFDQKWTFGEKISDKIAEFGGSWTFIFSFAAFMGIWIILNSYALLFKPFDPYPFILLNLLLSTLAAIQAPIIMMSQNRQEAKDRLRSQYDYKVNLKSELEIRTLHEKVDHLLTHQWDKMVKIQELQMELLNDIKKNSGKRTPNNNSKQ